MNAVWMPMLLGAAAAVLAASAVAYEVVPAAQPGEYLKWGPSRRAAPGPAAAR